MKGWLASTEYGGRNFSIIRDILANMKRTDKENLTKISLCTNILTD